MTRRELARMAALSAAAGGLRAASGDVSVDCAFPGGNIIVDSIEGATVSLRQDLRDTAGDWFYWHFRVRGAAGRTLAVRFTRSAVIGARGPAVSLDRGLSWQWSETADAARQSFTYAVPSGSQEARFCMTIPYLESNLRAFLKRYRRSRFLRTGVLCRTTIGRSVELLEAGAVGDETRPVILLTARHHACESIAGFTLEGLLGAVLDAGEPCGRLRRNFRFLAVPFVDKDGVEDGDQGKNRRPRDHNRDYSGASVHASPAAIRKLVGSWPAGRLRFALDLHGPWLRGAGNEEIHFVGGPAKESWARIERLAAVLESIQTGPLPFRARNNLPFGKSWNTAANTSQGKSFSGWAAELPGIWAAGSLEIPYANAGGAVVTADAARALGSDLACSLGEVLES